MPIDISPKRITVIPAKEKIVVPASEFEMGEKIGGATVGATTQVWGQGDSVFVIDPASGISLGSATFSSAPFRVNMAGQLTATDAILTGSITATTGIIGGWTISGTAIYLDGATDVLSSGMASADYPFYAGKKYADRATAPFRVTPAGVMYSTGAIIDGTSTIGGITGTQIGYVATSTADAVPSGLTCSSTGIATGSDGSQSAYVVLTWTAI